MFREKTNCFSNLFGRAIICLTILLVGGSVGLSQDNVNSIDPLLIKPGDLPGYDLIHLALGEETELEGKYLESLMVLNQDAMTSSVIFPEVPNNAEFARLALPDLVKITLDQNFGLLNSERGVQIARSQTRSAEAPFIPYVDLVSSSQYTSNRNQNATRINNRLNTVGTTRETDVFTNSVGVESGVALPSGGNLQFTSDGTRTDTRVSDGGGANDNTGFASNAEVRFLQPLLRGGGFEVGTAELRRARIQEMRTILNDRISERNTVLNAIESYYEILLAARQLEVSRGAIQIRLQTLYEARERYNVGRVDESEILRAEITYLGELQTAIRRRRTLDEQREQLLLLLGLPLDTPISFIDITPELAKRGRVDIPKAIYAEDECLSSRMELMLSDLSIATSELSLTVSRNNVQPDLNFTTGYNRYDSGGSYSDALGYENDGWDVGLDFRIPLINIQRREGLRQSIISLEQIKTDRISTERNLLQQVMAYRRNVISAEIQLVIGGKNVEQSRKSLELISGRYEVGFANVTEVRIAQDDLFQAETNYVDTLLSYQVAIARLYVALGRPLF
jgi:outer membrane protein